MRSLKVKPVVLTAVQQHGGQQDPEAQAGGTLRRLTRMQHPAVLLLLVCRGPDC